VYSFAIIFWETLTRRLPYDELGSKIAAMALLIKVMNGTRPSLDSIKQVPIQQLLMT
jgi:hypothetical protein